MGRRGVHPAAAARTTPEARRARPLVERWALRWPRLRVALTRLVLRMPRSGVRRAILAYFAARVYGAFIRDDWEVNTMFFHPDKYVFHSGDFRNQVPGMDDVYRGADGYMRAMDDIWEAFADVDNRLEDLVEIDQQTVVPVVRFFARGRGSGAQVDQLAAAVIVFEDGQIVDHTYWWDVGAAFRSVGLDPKGR